MKKRLSVPTIWGLIAGAAAIAVFKTPLFDGVYQAREWVQSTSWGVDAVLMAIFALLGAAMYICAVGRGGRRRISPLPLVIGGLMCLYCLAYLINEVLFWQRSGAAIAFQYVDFLGLMGAMKPGFGNYTRYALFTLSGYMLAFGLYGRKDQ